MRPQPKAMFVSIPKGSCQKHPLGALKYSTKGRRNRAPLKIRNRIFLSKKSCWTSLKKDTLSLILTPFFEHDFGLYNNRARQILDVLANISGPGAYFSKPIFALKPYAQAGWFKYREPYKQNEFFLEL